MSYRFKYHKFGSRYAIRRNELIQYLFLPASLKVECYRVIVSHSFETEVGHWHYAKPFSHFHGKLSLDAQRMIIRSISSLKETSMIVKLQATAEAAEKHENVERAIVTFWDEDNEVSVANLQDSYYIENGIELDIAKSINNEISAIDKILRTSLQLIDSEAI